MSSVYAYLSQPVAASLSIAIRDDDSFFNPVRLGHTGYGFDGVYYTVGVPNTAQIASWSSEGVSATRGALASFPTAAVVLVSSASVSILDATTDSLNLWMLFYLSDGYALPNNFTGGSLSFTAGHATWADGMLSILLKSDPGAVTVPVASLTFDFSGDAVYVDYSLPPL